MRKPNSDEFIAITGRNMQEIARELNAGKGIVIVASPEYYTAPAHVLTGEFKICLFDKPIIDLNRKILIAPRGTKKVNGQDWQTGWENDREYRLAPKPSPSDDPTWEFARKLFKKLSVGRKYQFEIDFASCPGSDLGYKKDRALYVPRLVSPRAALTFALTWMIDMWNAQEENDWPPAINPFKFTKKHIKKIVDYALADLKTGSVLKHNIQAGQDADMMVGLGPV